MKKTKLNPFVITDTKNISSYHSLILGLQWNDASAVKLALPKVDLKKVTLRYDQGPGFSEILTEKLYSPFEYAEKYSTSEILELLASKRKLTQDDKMKIVIKAIMSGKGVTEIKKFVPKSNVNKKVKICSFESPFNKGKSSREVTLLGVACYYDNIDAVKVLLEMDADPNLRSGTETPGHLAISSSTNTEALFEILTLLKASGANFYLKSEGSTVWSRMFYPLPAAKLKKLFIDYVPETLSDVIRIEEHSDSLASHWKKHSTQAFKKWPLINDFYKYKGMKITINQSLNNVKNVESFFKHKSLKKALQARYGVSSPRMTTLMMKTFSVDRNLVIVRGGMLQRADFLKDVFDGNVSDFLEMLESEKKGVDHVMSWSRSNKEIPQILKVFSHSEAKKLMTTQVWTQPEDIARMFRNHTARLTAALKEVPFSEVDDFKKIHNFFVGEIEKILTENFDLNQEKNFPALSKVEAITLKDDFGVVVAKGSHELLDWGKKMSHCVGTAGYADQARDGKVIILAITKGNEPKYCVEIKAGRIKQVQGKSGTTPNPDVMERFTEEMKGLGLVR